MVSMNFGPLESDLLSWIQLLIVMGMVFTGILVLIEGDQTGTGFPRVLNKWLMGATMGILLPDVFRWIISRIGA